MKIFISWSGERSQALAEALRGWLPLVLHYAKPWLSRSDIQAGDRWSVEVAKELQESNFGIICVTKDNLNSTWILFESGALAKSMEDGRVIPLLLDLDFKEISGPLAQFQAKKAEKAGIKELIDDLNKSAPAPEPAERLDMIFEPLYAQLGDAIEQIPSNTSSKQIRTQGEILEELVSSVRNVEMRVRDAMDEEPGYRRKFRRRVSLGMLMDITRSLSDDPHDPIQILIFFSMFRDDLPWLYELALSFYRGISDGNRDQAQTAFDKLKRALEMGSRGPLFDILGVDNKMMQMMLMDAREFIPAFRFENIDELENRRAKAQSRNRTLKRPAPGKAQL